MSQIGDALRTKMPGLYRAIFTPYMAARALQDMPRYWYCRLAGKPYFGPVMLGGQTWPSREPHMRAALEQVVKARKKAEGVRVLEIGSWAGGSAVLWGKELERHGVPGTVTCVDPWMPFIQKEQLGVNTALSIMDRVARRDKIFPLFWHNIKSAGLSHRVLPFRARSTDALPLLAPKSYDLVFVDGSHAYTDFFHDLKHAMPLVREGGILCGDDLEVQFPGVDGKNALANREKDFIVDPKSGHGFHPGICMGIWDTFRRPISSWDGFWAIQRKGQKWVDVSMGKSAGKNKK